MRAFRKAVAIALGSVVAVVVVFTAIAGPPGSRVSAPTPTTRELSALKQIAQKIVQYHVTQTSEQSGILPTTTIDELVTMNTLDPADANYLRENRVDFHGYDRRTNGGATPMFIAPFPPESPRQQIVINSDTSGQILSLHDRHP